MGTGTCREVMLAAALLAVIVSERAASADRIGQPNGNVTQLGMQLALLAARHRSDPRSGAYWREACAVIEASRPARDAEADAAAGHTGFMTHANDTFAERPHAPGVLCADRSEPVRRGVLLFGYATPLGSDAGKALLAFDGYARAYNLQRLKSGALGDTSCRAAGE